MSRDGPSVHGTWHRGFEPHNPRIKSDKASRTVHLADLRKRRSQPPGSPRLRQGLWPV